MYNGTTLTPYKTTLVHNRTTLIPYRTNLLPYRSTQVPYRNTQPICWNPTLADLSARNYQFPFLQLVVFSWPSSFLNDPGIDYLGNIERTLSGAQNTVNPLQTYLNSGQ